MSFKQHYDDKSKADYSYESKDAMSRRRKVQRIIEDKLEKQRMKEDSTEFYDDEFDWDNNEL